MTIQDNWVLILDEVACLHNTILGGLSLASTWLKNGKNNSELEFGNVSILLIGEQEDYG